MAEKQHTILKKYHHLALRDLLYQQAELCHLEYEHDLIIEKDASQGDERQYYDREWWYLEQSRTRGFHGEQWQSALKIRHKLKEYCMMTTIFQTV
jgi:hypothetical protein